MFLEFDGFVAGGVWKFVLRYVDVRDVDGDVVLRVIVCECDDVKCVGC